MRIPWSIVIFRKVSWFLHDPDPVLPIADEVALMPTSATSSAIGNTYL